MTRLGEPIPAPKLEDLNDLSRMISLPLRTRLYHQPS